MVISLEDVWESSSISVTGVSSISGVWEASVGHDWSDWWVVDQRGGGSQDSGGSSEDSWVSLTSSSLTGLGGGNSGEVSGLGLGNLWGVLDWFWGNSVIDWGNKRLWVESWGNQGLWVEGWGNWETRVSNTETSSVSNVFNSLELTVGVNIRVSSGDSSVGVSDLILGGVDVGVSVVEVAELVLGVELAAGVGGGGVGGDHGGGGHWSGGVCDGSGGGGVGDWVASVWVSGVGQRSGHNLGLLAHTNCYQSRQGNLKSDNILSLEQQLLISCSLTNALMIICFLFCDAKRNVV